MLLMAACAAQPTHKNEQAKTDTDTANTRRVRCVTVPTVPVAGSYVQSMTNTNYSNCTGSSDGAH